MPRKVTKKTAVKKAAPPKLTDELDFEFSVPIRIRVRAFDDGTVVADRAVISAASVTADALCGGPQDTNWNVLDELLYGNGSLPPLMWEGYSMHPDFQER